MHPAARSVPGFVGAALASMVSLFSAESAAASALGSAVKRNDAPAWSALLAQKSDVKARDASGDAALHHAALNHDLAAVAADADAAVTYARDIKPLLERSCAGCHDGEKPRAGFVVTSREALLNGGGSGDPAVAPGYAEDRLLVDYVTGKIEDLEMPPLDRRAW